MKKVEIKVRKKLNVIISIIIAFLGFATACEKEPNVLYGTPHATFIVKGNIQSKLNTSNIPNIQVLMGYNYNGVIYNDTAYSDINGDYEVKFVEFPTNQTFLVQFNDIDGATNGEFDSFDTTVEFINPEFTNASGSWDQGETEKELNIQLDPK